MASGNQDALPDPGQKAQDETSEKKRAPEILHLKNDTIEVGSRYAHGPIGFVLPLTPGQCSCVKDRRPPSLSGTAETIKNRQQSAGVVYSGGLCRRI